jgi:hypothetical protein
MMAHLDLLAQRVAAKPLQRFVLLNARPYRLEGEGGKTWDLCLPLDLKQTELDRRSWMEGLEIRRRMRVMNVLKSLARYPSGNHY